MHSNALSIFFCVYKFMQQQKKAQALMMAGHTNNIMNGAFSHMQNFLENQEEFICEALGYPEDYELLFTASEHNFSAAAFHERCDDIEDTIVLIETDNGKMIGGYTHYPWTSPENAEPVNDPDCKAFIFSQDMMDIFKPQNGNSLIVRWKNAGPIFGSGHDIFISDGCN